MKLKDSESKQGNSSMNIHPDFQELLKLHRELEIALILKNYSSKMMKSWTREMI